MTNLAQICLSTFCVPKTLNTENTVAKETKSTIGAQSCKHLIWKVLGGVIQFTCIKVSVLNPCNKV